MCMLDMMLYVYNVICSKCQKLMKLNGRYGEGEFQSKASVSFASMPALWLLTCISYMFHGIDKKQVLLERSGPSHVVRCSRVCVI